MVSSALSLPTLAVSAEAVLAGSCTPTPARLRLMAAKAEEDRDRGEDLEEDDRSNAEPPDLPQVRMPGDADHQRRKQQRRDDGLDQPQEDHRQHAQIRRGVREVVADLCAQQHGDENPCRQGTLEASVGDERGEADPAHGRDRRGAETIRLSRQRAIASSAARAATIKRRFSSL